MKDGTYTATIASHHMAETKKGEPQVVISFDIEDAGVLESIKYYGYFSDKARPYTIKNLITCGLVGNNPAGDLQIGKKVQIVVESEVYEGKSRQKVKYINQEGGSATKLSQDLAKAKFAQLEGDVMKARAEFNADEPLPF